jgi:iron donor protein CyaY
MEGANMDDQEFQSRADAALNSLYRKLSSAADQYDFEPDFNAGALSIEFEEPKGRFVVSPNSPVRQIWVSARSKSFKLEWDQERGTFILPETKQTLDDLIASEISQHMGEAVRF